MEIVSCDNKNEWNDALFKLSNRPCFLQSFEWGEILAGNGNIVERLLIIDNNIVVAAAQVVYKKIVGQWRYAFSAKGPVVDNKEYRISNNELFEILKKYFEKKNVVFYKMEPVIGGNNLLLQATSYKLPAKEVLDIDPPATLLLDLNKSEEELFGQMHHKTRYNIRLAEKKGLTVSEDKNFKVFWDLFKITAKRDGFFLLAENVYKKVLESPLVYMRTVYYKNTPLAVGCYIGFGGSIYYLYGASNNKERQLMGPYLLQWTAIKLAKQLGYKYYDWFGIAPRTKEQGARNKEQESEYQYDLKHRYAGITRFKLGFGGVAQEDPGTFDLIFYPFKYRVYRVLRSLKRLV